MFVEKLNRKKIKGYIHLNYYCKIEVAEWRDDDQV